MQAAALIAEFNPFHNGHHYIMEQIKEMTNHAPLIVIMSGDFVQRGEPAVFSKQYRTRMALNAGADLVIELPVRFSTGNAGEFAKGAVAVLSQLPCVKWLFFGSESGNLSLLQTITQKLSAAKKSDHYQSLLKQYLKLGYSYPNARSKAYADFYQLSDQERQDTESALSSPNELLGMEYLKALTLLSSDIEPVAVRRIQSGYHDTTLPQNASGKLCPSATALRQELSKSTETPSSNDGSHTLNTTKTCDLPNNSGSPVTALPDSSHDSDRIRWENYIPQENQACFHEAKETILTSDSLCGYLSSRLLYLSPRQLSDYLDINPDIANTIADAAKTPFSSFDEMAKRVKKKNITLSRARRALLHIALELRKWEHTDAFPFTESAGLLPIRVLGFRKSSAGLLKNSKAPVITTGATINQYLQNHGTLLRESMQASMLYRNLVFQTHLHVLSDEYHSFPIIMK